MRRFSPPPPPPADAAPVLEELVTLRVREKVQSDLRQDRTELFNKIDSAVNTKFDAVNTRFDAVTTKIDTKIDAVNTKIDTKIDAVNTKLDSTKLEISWQAATFALAGAMLGVSGLGFFFEKKVAVVDAKPVFS